MTPQNEILAYVILLLLLDTIPLPLPVTALVLLYVVLKRPEWFSKMYHQLYN
jgi:hypothetical protein